MTQNKKQHGRKGWWTKKVDGLMGNRGRKGPLGVREGLRKIPPNQNIEKWSPNEINIKTTKGDVGGYHIDGPK